MVERLPIPALRYPRRLLLAAAVLATGLSGWSVASVAAQAPAGTSSAATAIEEGQRVLVVGHSFHQFIANRAGSSSTPDPLAALAKEAGFSDHALLGVNFIGNSTPLQHWNAGGEAGNWVKNAICTGQVDVLTLSPNAQIPEPAIDRFVDLAVEHNPEVRVLVQMSWSAWDGQMANVSAGGGASGPREPVATSCVAGGPTSPPPPAPRPAAGANAAARAGAGAAGAAQGGAAGALAAGGFQNADRDAATLEDLAAHRASRQDYEGRVRAQLSAINARHGRDVAFVVPASYAVIRLREEVIRGNVPGITRQSELFSDAMGHAQRALQDLIVYTWFASIYGRSPVGLTALIEDNDESAAHRHRILQELALEAVQQEPMSGRREKGEE